MNRHWMQHSFRYPFDWKLRWGLVIVPLHSTSSVNIVDARKDCVHFVNHFLELRDQPKMLLSETLGTLTFVSPKRYPSTKDFSWETVYHLVKTLSKFGRAVSIQTNAGKTVKVADSAGHSFLLLGFLHIWPSAPLWPLAWSIETFLKTKHVKFQIGDPKA